MKTIIIILCLMGLMACKSPFEPDVKDAVFTITEKKQTYYDMLDYYSLVEIHYKIKNTGNVDIDYYKIWFEVTCEDGSTFSEWDNGSGVSVGKEMSDMTYINTSDKKYTSVVITDYELTSYDYGD